MSYTNNILSMEEITEEQKYASMKKNFNQINRAKKEHDKIWIE